MIVLCRGAMRRQGSSIQVRLPKGTFPLWSRCGEFPMDLLGWIRLMDGAQLDRSQVFVQDSKLAVVVFLASIQLMLCWDHTR